MRRIWENPEKTEGKETGTEDRRELYENSIYRQGGRNTGMNKKNPYRHTEMNVIVAATKMSTHPSPISIQGII